MAMTAATLLAVLAGQALWPTDQVALARRLRASDAVERRDAIRHIAGATGEWRRRLLLEATDDLDPQVRHDAARVLLRIDEAAAVAIAARWLDGGDTRERGAGLVVLRDARTPTPGSVAAAARLLRDPDTNLKLMVLGALSGKDLRPVLPEILDTLDDPAPAVRLRGLDLAGEATDPRAVALVALRLDDVDPAIRVRAAEVLARLDDARAMRLLLPLLSASDETSRLAGIDALVVLRSSDAVPGLARLAARTPPDLTARRAIRALGLIPAATALEALAELRRRDVGGAATIDAMAGVGAPALPHLIEAALERARPAVALAAIRALGALRDRRALPTLLALAEGPNPIAHRCAAAAALAAFAADDPRLSAALPRPPGCDLPAPAPPHPASPRR